ncbi:MAG: hypothetical protein AAF797_16445 [Planctomycetota bacterium]
MATTLTVQRGDELPWEAVARAVGFGLRTGPGAMWLRDDVIRHVGEVAGRLGTRYVRGPALTGDAVLARSPSGYGFEGVVLALERMVETGVKPMVEVGSMPLVLARGDESVGASKYRSSPPADWNKWEAFVDRLMGELVGRFGAAELRGWLFTVWDRPDTERWAGTRGEYLELYERTARAIKRVDAGLRVGGPTVMDPGFAEAFVDGVAGVGRELCDYVVVQTDIADVLAGRDAWLMDLRRRVSSRLGDDVPVVVELDGGESGLDASASAGALVSAVLRLGERCDGVVVGSATDIDDTDGLRYEPFHGGRGLLTVNGLPKAGLHALSWLAGMREGRRVGIEWGGDGLSEDAGGIAVERGPGEAAVLVWSGDAEVRLRLARLPGSTAEVLRVSPGAGSACEVWEELGRPAFVDRGLLERLEEASRPVASSLWPASEALELPAGSVALITAKG